TCRAYQVPHATSTSAATATATGARALRCATSRVHQSNATTGTNATRVTNGTRDPTTAMGIASTVIGSAAGTASRFAAGAIHSTDPNTASSTGATPICAAIV